MWNWWNRIFKKKVNNPCNTCVYWKSEEENNVAKKLNENLRYCDVYKNYTKSNHTCALHIEEKFEATVDSIQTEEIDLNYEMSIEESERNDTGSQQK